MKLKTTYSLITLAIILLSVSSYAQESTDIHKTRSSATIKGVKYYLHTVEKGQTLFAIAKFYNMDVNDLVIENPEAIDGIKPGQILKIPVEKRKITTASVDTSSFILHKVEQGQTLYAITKQYGVSAEKLKLINPELKDGLKVGQTIKIPSVKKPESTVVVENKVITDKVVNPLENKQDLSKVEAADRISVINYAGELKSEYNIALFLPFNADDANSIDVDKVIKGDADFPNKTKVALDFYEGALIAIDSLKKQKLNAKIFVYDVDDRDSLNIYTILKKPELAEMNLIIGPLYGSSFMSVAKFAKEHEIAIVSPFTQINKILFNNPYVCKVSPSTTLQIEQMATFAVDTFETQNILLVNSMNAKEVSFYNAFKTTANKELIAKGHAPADSIKEVIGLSGMTSNLSTTKVNVIVLPSNNQSYVTDFISKLNSLRDKYKIVLFGMQGWNNYDNLDFEYLNNLELHSPSNSYVDYSSAATKAFIKEYRERYKTEPEMYAYQGYDVVYYFISNLQKQGSGFLKGLCDDRSSGLETQFVFSQVPADSGFENKHVFILKYKDFKQVNAN